MQMGKIMNNNQDGFVDDVITFFKRLGASNELSNRNFDTGDFYSEDYCNFIVDIAKKYELYDEIEESKDVNYILNLEEEISEFFRKELNNKFKM